MSGDLTDAEYPFVAQDLADRYSGGYIGVGDGITAFTGAETDLNGTNKARAPVTSVLVSGSTVTFYAEFVPGVGSFEWNEVGLFADSTGGHMAAAKVISSPGTKGVSDRWTASIELPIAAS